MREIVRYGLTLAVICVIAGASLAGMNSLTKSRIIAQAVAEEEANFKDIFSGAERFEPVKRDEKIIYYRALDKENKLIGAVFKASGKGYSSTIDSMVGMNLDGSITAIKVINQNETPSLGSRVAEAPFTRQFSGRNSQNLEEVSAITGATISSKAVIDSVNIKAKEIMELIKNAR